MRNLLRLGDMVKILDDPNYSGRQAKVVDSTKAFSLDVAVEVYDDQKVLLEKIIIAPSKLELVKREDVDQEKKMKEYADKLSDADQIKLSMFVQGPGVNSGFAFSAVTAPNMIEGFRLALESGCVFTTPSEKKAYSYMYDLTQKPYFPEFRALMLIIQGKGNTKGGLSPNDTVDNYRKIMERDEFRHAYTQFEKYGILKRRHDEFSLKIYEVVDAIRDFYDGTGPEPLIDFPEQCVSGFPILIKDEALKKELEMENFRNEYQKFNLEKQHGKHSDKSSSSSMYKHEGLMDAANRILKYIPDMLMEEDKANYPEQATIEDVSEATEKKRESREKSTNIDKITGTQASEATSTNAEDTTNLSKEEKVAAYCRDNAGASYSQIANALGLSNKHEAKKLKDKADKNGLLKLKNAQSQENSTGSKSSNVDHQSIVPISAAERKRQKKADKSKVKDIPFDRIINVDEAMARHYGPHLKVGYKVRFGRPADHIVRLDADEQSCATMTKWVNETNPFPATGREFDEVLKMKIDCIVNYGFHESYYKWMMEANALAENSSGSILFGHSPLFRHNLCRELYELAPDYYRGGTAQNEAIERIKEIGHILNDKYGGFSTMQLHYFALALLTFMRAPKMDAVDASTQPLTNYYLSQLVFKKFEI